MNKRSKKLTLTRESLRTLTADETALVGGAGSLTCTNTSPFPSRAACTFDVSCVGSNVKICY